MNSFWGRKKETVLFFFKGGGVISKKKENWFKKKIKTGLVKKKKRKETLRLVRSFVLAGQRITEFLSIKEVKKTKQIKQKSLFFLNF